VHANDMNNSSSFFCPALTRTISKHDW